MEKMKRFTLDVGWAFFSNLATLLLGFALGVVLARWLGAANLGLYKMVYTIQGIVALFADVGIPAALTKYVAEYKDDSDRLIQITSAGFISSIVSGVVVAIILYALSGVLASVFNMPALAHLLKVLAFVFPIYPLQQAIIGTCNGLRKMKTYAFLLILRSALMILFTVFFIWLGFGVEGAVFGIVLSVAGGCIFGLFSLRGILHLSLHRFIQNARNIMLFGIQVFGTSIMELITTQTDIMMLGYFLASEDVGYYSIAVGLSGLVLLVPKAIAKVTYPNISEYWSKNNYGALQRMIDKSMKYSACILLPLGLGVGFFGRGIITTIYGTEFIPAALPMYILVSAHVIRGGTITSVGGAFNGIGRPDIDLKLNVLSGVMNIALNILLIPRFGIAGAAVATAISLLARVVIYFVLMPKMLGVRIDIRWYSFVMGSALIALVLFLIAIKLINLYVIGGIILCAYMALVFKVFLTKEDKTILSSLGSSLLSRFHG